MPGQAKYPTPGVNVKPAVDSPYRKPSKMDLLGLHVA
jgi:hypothetical protein